MEINQYSKSLNLLRGKETVDEVLIRSDTFEYKLDIKLSLKGGEETTTFLYSKSNKKEFTLGGIDETEKELKHFKTKYMEVEQENYILAEKIQEFENKVDTLMKEKRERDKATKDYEKTIQEKENVIRNLERTIDKERSDKELLRSELEQIKTLEDYFDKMKTLLRQTNPELETVVDIALKQERIQSEKKNQKILEMFQTKDDTIEDLKNRLEEMDRDYQKLMDMMEDQRVLIQTSEDNLRREQKEAKALKDSLKNQNERVIELERELQRVNKSVAEYINKLKLKEDEARGFLENNEKLIKEIEYFKRELSKSQDTNAQLVKERSYLAQQINEYAAREGFINELYNRQQGNKDERAKQLIEKEQTIKNLENKLREQNQQIEGLIAELSKEQESKREQQDKFYEENEDKIKELIEENEELKKLLHQMEEQLHQERHDEGQGQLEHGSVFSNPMHSEDLKSPYELAPADHRKQIADLKEQVNQLTESLHDIQHSLDKEKKEKGDLVTSYNVKLSEMVNQIEELKSSRTIQVDDQSFRKNDRGQEDRKNFELEEVRRRERQAYLELESKYEELERKVELLENEKKRCTEEIDILSQRLELQGKSVEEFQNESLISRLNSRISVLKLKEQKLYEENAKLETLYNELREEYESAKAGWDAERNELMQMLEGKEGRDLGYGKASVYSSKLDSSAMKYSQDKMRESELGVSTGGESLRREIQILKSIKNNLENEILLAVNKEKFLQNNIEMLTNEKNEYKERANYLRDQLNQLEDQLRERDRGSKEEIFSMRKQILDLQSELKVTEDTKQHLEKELEERRSLEDRLRMADKLKEKVENDLVNLKADYEGQIDELVDQIRTLQKLNAEFKMKISDQEMDYNMQINTLTERESMINKLEGEKALLENKVTRLQGELDELRKVNDKVASQMMQLRAEFNTVKNDTNEELKRRDHVEKEYKNRIMSLEERLEEAVREKERLRSELNNEVERLSKTHQETINLLREDNRELEKKYFDELSDKRREDEMTIVKEREYIAEVNNLKRELDRLMDENSHLRGRKGHESGKKETKKRRSSAQKSARVFNSDTEEDSSLMASREGDRFKLYEIDVREKNAKIMDLREQLSIYERENLRLVKENEKLGRIIEDQRRELDQQRREILSLDSEKRSIERNDVKVNEELKELRVYLSELKTERDRINSEKKYSEENMKADQRRLEHLIQIVRDYEDKQAFTESTYRDRISDLERELNELSIANQRYSKDYEQAKALITLREKEIFRKDKDLDELRERLVAEQEENEELRRRLQGLEDAVVKETDRCIAIQNEYREERDRAGEALSILKDEMLEQNKKYEETMSIYEKQIAIVKEKFINDVKEIQTKINVYFNQTESIKKSVSVAQEKKNLEKIFERYADNTTQVAQKEATIGSLKDRIKSLMTENKNTKAEAKRLQEAVDKLTADLEAAQKKFKTQTIPKVKKISSSGTSTAKNANFMETNKENVDENDQDISKKASFKEMVALEAQLLTAKGENKKLTEETRQLEDLNAHFQQEIENLMKSEELLQGEVKRLNREINEQQKNYKSEINKMLAEVENVKSKWYSPESYDKIVQELKDSENNLKQMKEDLQRKKEYIQTIKTVKENKVGEEGSIKKENEQLKEEIEKLKRQIKEGSRKDTTFKDFREKYEALKQSEKALQEEKNSTQEKMKALKVEIARKESAIKDLKDKIDLLSINNDTRKLSEEELEKSKELIRKLKAEIERKDQALKSLKSKLDSTLFELDHVKTETISKVQGNATEVEREIRKHEQTKMQLKNIEAQYQNMVFLLRRLYRDTFSVVQKLKSKVTKEDTVKADHFKKFSDSINILNLSPEEIQMFVNPESNQMSQTTEISFNQHQQIERFEKELSNAMGINASLVYDMVSSIIEERVSLEKKAK